MHLSLPHGAPLRAVALAAILAGPGCSFVLVRPPPDPVPATGPIECSMGGGPLAADILMAIAAGAVSGAAFSFANMFDDGADGAALLAVTAVTAAPFIASAAYGTRQTNACSKLKAQRARCDPESGAGCGPLGLPPGTSPRHP